jgi:hypothetical protein
MLHSGQEVATRMQLSWVNSPRLSSRRVCEECDALRCDTVVWYDVSEERAYYLQVKDRRINQASNKEIRIDEISELQRRKFCPSKPSLVIRFWQWWAEHAARGRDATHVPTCRSEIPTGKSHSQHLILNSVEFCHRGRITSWNRSGRKQCRLIDVLSHDLLGGPH